MLEVLPELNKYDVFESILFPIGQGLSPSANLHLQGNGILTGDLVVGSTAGNSTIEISGTIGHGIQTVSSNTTLSGNSVIMVNSSSDNVTVTLPYAGNVIGRHYTIKKISTSNTVTVSGIAKPEELIKTSVVPSLSTSSMTFPVLDLIVSAQRETLNNKKMTKLRTKSF